MRMKQLALLFCIVLFSCATMNSQKITNLTPATLKIKPHIEYYQDPDVAFDKYATFSVVPPSAINEKANVQGGILEKQLLFEIRNFVEGKGYRFVPLNQKPDFLVTMDAKSEYKEQYVPPQTLTVPWFVPGQTITTQGTSMGSFNLNARLPSGTAYGYGTYSGLSSSTTNIPGYMTTETITRPGYTVGYHYPFILVACYDGADYRNIWLGSGIGTSANPDVRVSGQYVITDLVEKFPNCKHAEQNFQKSTGSIGVRALILTNNGNDFYPTVARTVADSPAAKAGIEVYDMIIEINGTSTRNKPGIEVLDMMKGDPGQKVTLTVWRLEKKLEFQVVRVPREQLKM
ncbi:MAG: PDZ domain-containing protein [Syntrophobacteraceae bacterium]